MAIATSRRRFKSIDSTPPKRTDLWKEALEKDLGNNVVIQICGLGSDNHIVFARMKPVEHVNPVSDEKMAVTLGKVIEVLVDEGHRSIAKSILEQHVHIQPDSYPSALELLHLGSVWILNETAYASGSSAHAKRLSAKDVNEIPSWEDMTLRVHYVPDRFHSVHEVDWGKYCRGMLLDGSVSGNVGGKKVVVPMMGLPDKRDGVLVYENEDLGFAILNKPGNAPIFATTSNHAEDVVSMYTSALKERRESNNVHHVSIPLRIETECYGLTLASTKKEFCAYMTNQLECIKHANHDTANTTIKKLYRCLVCIRDPTNIDRIEGMMGNILTHYVDVKTATPKRFVRNKPSGNSTMQQCFMRIIKVGDEKYRAACVRSRYSDSNDSTLAHRLWNPHLNIYPAEELGVAYVMQLEVELLNEVHRPHQLRGQLAALGCPIVGDEAYGGGVCLIGAHRHTWSRMAVQLCRLEFPLPKWSDKECGEVDEMVEKKVLEPSEVERCEFSLTNAWWTEYLLDYERYL